MSERRFRAGACTACRIRKRKCLPANSIGSCTFCVVKGTHCSLSQSKAKAVAPPNQQSTLQEVEAFASPHNTEIPRRQHPGGFVLQSSTSVSNDSAHLPEKRLLFKLVDLYFRLIHNVVHTMFHEHSCITDMQQEKLPPMILFAMIALSARFSKDAFLVQSNPRVRGKPYVDEAMRLLHLEMMHPTILTIQTSILIGNYLGGEGNVQGKYIYIGIARLHAEAIRLHEPLEDASILINEVRRRTWLSVMICDKWGAADMSLHPSVIEKKSNFYPMVDDIAFVHNHIFTHEDSLIEDNERCMNHRIWHQMASTVKLFQYINNLISNLSIGEKTMDAYSDEVYRVAHQLDHWVDSLPTSLKYNTTNVTHYAQLGLARTFLGMHIGYYHFCQLLYYPYLNQRQVPCHSPSRDVGRYESFARMCKRNALAVSAIIRLAFDSEGCELLYFLYGHILVVSSSIHLHTLLSSSDQPDADAAREQLISNFEILMKLKIYWPVIDFSIGRLQIFQNECRKSAAGSFFLDKWMLKFLMEHTADLGSEHRLLTPTIPPSSIPRPNLSTLLQNDSMSNELIVESALSWLQDQDATISITSGS